KTFGVSETMMVKTSHGYHFYFVGSRELPDAKYKRDDISGDLKNHGYVLAAGALHPEGKEYELLNLGVPPAPLPDVLKNYTAEKKPKKVREPHKTSAITPSTLPQPEYTDRKVWPGSRHDYLRRQACYLRKMGCEVDGITAALK